jgi:hypothetical protein
LRTRRNKETGFEAEVNGKEALIRLMQGLWSNFISLSSLILHSTPASNGENTGNKENWVEAYKRDHACSGMDRPSWGFRKATTFHHITAIYQRSLLHLLLWVQSQLPRAHDEPVLNEGRQTRLPGKEKFKKLIAYKKE